MRIIPTVSIAIVHGKCDVVCESESRQKWITAKICSTISESNYSSVPTSTRMKFTQDLFAGVELLGSGSNLEFYESSGVRRASTRNCGVYFGIGDDDDDDDDGGDSALEYLRLSLSWKCRKLWFPRTIHFVGEPSPRANEISSTSEPASLVCLSSELGFPRATSSREILRHFRLLLRARAASTTPVLPFYGTGYHTLAIHYATCSSLLLKFQRETFRCCASMQEWREKTKYITISFKVIIMSSRISVI